MVALLVAWASWLVVVVVVPVSVGLEVFLGGMMGNEEVSSRQMEVSV